ncbi:MAG: hypothetical protein CMJ31_07840 [Phycisphaerae bacterium]|nr:hypothetical protein [Phycisphaerae bacterium]
MMRIGALIVAGAAVSASAQVSFTSNEATFMADATAGGNALSGFEDFESASFAPGVSVATLSDMVSFGTPNLDGTGSGLSMGLVNADIALGLGFGGVALAPGAFGNNTVVAGTAAVADSTTITMTGGGIRAIGFNVFDALAAGTTFDVNVFDMGGNLIGSTNIAGFTPETVTYLGIVSTVDIGSIQLDTLGVAGELLDNISTFTVPTPGSIAVLGLGGLVAARRRRD